MCFPVVENLFSMGQGSPSKRYGHRQTHTHTCAHPSNFNNRWCSIANSLYAWEWLVPSWKQCHSAPAYLRLCTQRTQEMFQVKHNCYWNKPKNINAFPHQHGNSAVFLKVLLGRRKQADWGKMAIRNPKYRGRARERELGSEVCTALVENPESVPSTHMAAPLSTSNPSSGESGVGPWGLCAWTKLMQYKDTVFLKGKRNPRQIIIPLWSHCPRSQI